MFFGNFEPDENDVNSLNLNEPNKLEKLFVYADYDYQTYKLRKDFLFPYKFLFGILTI